MNNKAILEKGFLIRNFTGLNNLDIFKIAINKCAEKFGFTQDEVGEAFRNY